MNKEIFFMNCSKCGKVFPEPELDLSHDVPKYIFNGDKFKADKYGRHYLCKKCHNIYKNTLFWAMTKNLPIEIKEQMIASAIEFAIKYFPKKEKKDDTAKTTN